MRRSPAALSGTYAADWPRQCGCHEQAKGPSDGPLAAGVLRPGSGRGAVLGRGAAASYVRAQGAAAYDHGPPGKLQLLMSERLAEFLERNY